MRKRSRYKARSARTIAVATLLIVVGLVASQAYSTAMTVAGEPLQNPAGPLTYSSDYSGVSAVVTRHESSDLTVNVSDQITAVTVQGNKASGVADVKVDLLDASATIVDTATIALPGAAGAYSTVVNLNLGTVEYYTAATVSEVYAAAASPPVDLTLNATDGYDEKDGVFLLAEGLLSIITSSNDDWHAVDTSGGTPGYFLSLQFDQTVPGGATIISVKVYIEHHEDDGYLAGEQTWEVGTGSLSSPTVLGSTIPTVLSGPGAEAVVLWDVSTIIDTVAEVNDMKVKIINSSTVGKKVNIDHAYVVVEYTP